MVNKKLKILMVAAENGALQNCKVGGIADVVRDLPPALADQDCEVNIVTPSYGFLHKQKKGAQKTGSSGFLFAKNFYNFSLFKISEEKISSKKITHFVVDNQYIFPPRQVNGSYQIYCDDPPQNPFATDAEKYAFFCRAVTEALKTGLFGNINCIHLHDWHASFLLVLRRYFKKYSFLKKIRTIYTIHNISIQGIRPFKDSESSLESWYPDIGTYKKNALSDPRWPNCINPMAVGIRLSDKVHAVSKSYAEEIIKPSDKPAYYGGDGLEKDLCNAKKQGRLVGILNGCEYPAETDTNKLKVNKLLNYLKTIVLKWSAFQEAVSGAHFLAYTKLNDLCSKRSGRSVVLTSVSRVVDQKFYLMRAGGKQYASGLQGILDGLNDRGIYILLGTGDRSYEEFFIDMSCKYDNFVFLNAYSDNCAKALYSSGHLFLMPSSHEPCGIGQMIAMREGQPCLAHEVGGLKDTVIDNHNGFTFSGNTVSEKTDNLVKRCMAALDIRQKKPAEWKKICKKASASRYLWKDSVREYIDKLYTD